MCTCTQICWVIIIDLFNESGRWDELDISQNDVTPQLLVI